ncbi:MAG: dethiobiotin synthase [Candidatus Saganbacteria bacterium]|uniref:ATP-dependent dethiobiotin synthetase BioD n=1 Tax=Candidatus Saganbacteria bacterium TaxID=2575572 RepID=A0A833KZS0_UNCSA|nr:MAG: dethiobiotin synthase [Candidatus Saganbacteria bacterium]
MNNYFLLNNLPQNHKGIFITGTDTGVGKTHITFLLAKYLLGQNLDVSIMKPISCGPKKESDALYLKEKLKLKDPLELINPIHFEKPLAPYPASGFKMNKTKLDKIFSAYKKLSSIHDLVLVEGIGGVMVPITKNYFVADLIKQLNIPAIIVARAGLGTINHTLLTVEILRRKKIDILGIILNGHNGSDLSEKTNARIIEEISKAPILAKIRQMGKAKA